MNEWDVSVFCRNKRHGKCVENWGDHRGFVPPLFCRCVCHRESGAERGAA